MHVDSVLTVYKHDKDKDDKKEETIQEKKVKLDKIVAEWKKKKAEGKGKLSDWLGQGAAKFDNNINGKK